MTLTPLDYNMTRREVLTQMAHWQFEIPAVESGEEPAEEPDFGRPVLRTVRKQAASDSDRRHTHAPSQTTKIPDASQ